MFMAAGATTEMHLEAPQFSVQTHADGRAHIKLLDDQRVVLRDIQLRQFELIDLDRTS